MLGAVANVVENKRLLSESAAGPVRAPSRIGERNQPPAAWPTALLLSRHQKSLNMSDAYGQFLLSQKKIRQTHCPCNSIATALQITCHTAAHARVYNLRKSCTDIVARRHWWHGQTINHDISQHQQTALARVRKWLSPVFSNSSGAVPEQRTSWCRC